jgi:RNA polymerase sigma-70 factor (ECF subfamily)
MDTTPITLLMKLRQPGAQDAWRHFVLLYTPLLQAWARRLGLQDQDTADLLQEVFAVLVRKLPEFDYDRDRSFRAWLRAVLVNKWREGRRRVVVASTAGLDPLPEPQVAADDELLAEAEYRQHLVQRALQLVQGDFQPTTWQAFQECVLAGKPAAAVARALGLSVNAVYLAKSRVVQRLHQELDGLLD